MERIVFDNEKFINLVEPNSCLWDTSNESYSDRNKKQQCWVEISREMNERFDELTANQRDKYAKDLQKKWKNLRNSFARELAKRKTVKSGTEATWKTYVFFEKLSFLMRCPSNKDTVSSTNDDSQQAQVLEEDYGDATTPTSEPLDKKLKLTAKKDTVDNEISKLLKESIRRRDAIEIMLNQDQDQDRHFLLSLLDDLKRVPIERKMDAKLSMIQALKAAILPTDPIFNS